MKSPFEFAPGQQRILLVAFIFLMLLSGLGSYDLSAPDEPRFALVAHEMLRDNHWLLPHRNENAYPDKPPLFFWSIAAVSVLGGGEVTALSARLPSALAACWVLWILWQFAGESRQRLNLIAVLVLLASFRFFFQARMAQIDMLLCALTTTAAWLGYLLITDTIPQGRRIYYQRLLGLCLGLGILAKGPVGYLVPAGACALFAGLCRSWRFYPRRALLWGLVPPLIWIGLLIIEVAIAGEWDYLNNLLFKQTVVRYVNPWHHYKPFYYFAQVLFYDFQPWIFVLLAAVPLRKAQRAALDNKKRFAWAVVLFTLVFFSLSKGKRNLYILPLYPFAAYLVAAKLGELQAILRARVSWSLLLPNGLLFLLGAALFAVGLGVADDKIPDYITAPPPHLSLGLVGGLVMVSALFGLSGALKGRIQIATACLLVTMGLINVLLYQQMLPWASPFRSARNFTEQAGSIIAAKDANPQVGMVMYRSAYRFYGRYPLHELADETNDPPGKPTLSEFWREHPNGWVILRRKNLEGLPEDTPGALDIHLTMKVGRGQELMLVTRKGVSPTGLQP